uniref:Coiled-coil domain containing 150 n=1 Tax=Callorhinchus milii TaxID=7868 RepID=A0A4W3GHH3_CALMI|eukprot:gi/632934943/ref/XP_007887121.1/ PREDICTED: coiled-coil domain-containing protein 150 [Callorhinchus milii]
MSRAPIPPSHVGATAPESFTVLKQRIVTVEEQTDSLFKELGALGVESEDLTNVKVGGGDIHRPVSPFHVRNVFTTESDVLWKNYESLVSRVCRLESVIQTLKLNVFRIQTEKELNPEHSAHVTERLAAMQGEHAEELKKLKREVICYRQHLSELSEEKESAQEEMERLSAALEITTATKADVAMAAEELKATKSRMIRRLQQINEQLSQEVSLRKALEESHVALLQRVQDMEKVVMAEREQVKTLQQDCLVLRKDSQVTQERLQQEQQNANDLDNIYKQLKIEADAKESIITQMADEAKNTHLLLNKHQKENTEIRCEITSLRDVAEKVQVLNDQLNKQCTELSTTLHSVSMENAKLLMEHQAALKSEQDKMTEKLREQDLLLDAARANITAELHIALREKQQFKKDLETLRLEHTQIQLKFQMVEDKATTHKELLKSVIVRLREDFKKADDEHENTQQEKDSLLDQVNKTLGEIIEERNTYEKQLTEKQLEVGTLSAALVKQQEENGRLMECLAAVEHQQHAQQQIKQVLAELTESKNKLAYEKGKLQTRVEQLQEELKCTSAANFENTKLKKRNTALESKYSQINTEFSTCKINTQRLEAQHKQAQLAMEQKEEDFAKAIKSRDEILREIQKLKEHSEVIQEKDKQKVINLQQQLMDCKQDSNKIAETLENVLTSHTKLQHTVEKLQTELGQRDAEIKGLHRERSYNHQTLQRLQAELQDLQAKLATTETQHNIQVEPLRKTLEISKQDNKKLARSLEQTLLTTNGLQIKLNQLQSELDGKELQQQQLQHTREQEAEDAKLESKMFAERIEALKNQFQSERETARKANQKEIMELKKGLCAAAKSAELSRANRELRQNAAELEKTITSLKAKIKDQKGQLKHYLECKATNTQYSSRMKEFEADLTRMEKMKGEYEKKNYEQSQMIHKFMTEMQSLQAELQSVAKNQHEAMLLCKQQEFQLETEDKLRHELQNKCRSLEEKVKNLQMCKEAAEQKLKEASLESQQISANLEEAHQWFKSKFDTLQTELKQSRERDRWKEQLGDKENLENINVQELYSRSRQRAKDTKRLLVKSPSESCLNRWETKQELKLLSRNYWDAMAKK